MNWYRCNRCSCYLDPGEGQLCEECLEQQKQRVLRIGQSQEMLQETKDGQITMRFQEVG